MYVTTVPVIDRLIAERRLHAEGEVSEAVRTWGREVRAEARELGVMLEAFDDDIDYGMICQQVGQVLAVVDSCPVLL